MLRTTFLSFANRLMTTTKMGSNVDIAGMRKPYKGRQEVFDVKDLVAREPFANFRHWFEIACKTEEILEANAMCLATATKDGKPSVRMVLLKGYDEQGFQFYTNYGSRKAKELDENPHANLMFYWEPLLQMIRIEGQVERLSEEESTQYFHSRPKESQIGACLSRQSSVIENRKVLENRQKELEEEYKDADSLPKPEWWGGYRLRPEVFEFWQGQTNRVHDRLVFRKKEGATSSTADDSWTLERLSP